MTKQHRYLVIHCRRVYIEEYTCITTCVSSTQMLRPLSVWRRAMLSSDIILESSLLDKSNGVSHDKNIAHLVEKISIHRGVSANMIHRQLDPCFAQPISCQF